MPLPVSVSALRAAQIGGTSVGSYGCLSVTELDSHANMAVAGHDCTIIARSGHHATVTPFSADLPVMEQVEIGDVAVAYDDPYSSRTYVLVIRNALLIPSMDHNLLPPFLVREACLFLDETPKFQSTDPSRDNRRDGNEDPPSVKWDLLLLPDEIAHLGRAVELGQLPGGLSNS